MKFDPTKPVQTRDGRKAAIFALDSDTKLGHTSDYPILGVFASDEVEGDFLSGFFTKEGLWRVGKEDGRDLVNTPVAPRFRDWTASDVPLGAWVKRSDWEHEAYAIVRISSTHIHLGAGGAISFQILASEWLHTTDGGKTWLPCKTQVEEA